MNKISDIFDELQQRGLIDANAVVNVTDDDTQEESPWFLQVLFGFSGIFASVLFIGFLTLVLFETNIFNSMAGLVITGLLLSAIGFGLFNSKTTRHNIFVSSLAFAISIAGQAYVGFALLAEDLPEPVAVWVFLVIQALLTLVMPSFFYRLLSAVVVLSASVYLLNYYGMPEASLGVLALTVAISHLQRYEILQYLPVPIRDNANEVIKAIAYASTIMLLAVSVYFIAAEYGNGFGYDDGRFYYNYPLAQILLILASLYAANLILKRYQVKVLSIVGIITVGAVIVLGGLSIFVSGLLATSLIIIIATANSQKVLLALGIIALVSYIFWYYYQLDTSLLIKSISMLVIGITILLMRWLLTRYVTDNHVSSMSAIDNQERPS